MTITSREIRLKSRPDGMPTAENFEVATVTLPDLQAGEMVVRNLFMSVDPYMRGRMADRRSYVPPFAIGEALTGGAVGQVVESNGGKFAVGDYVLSMYGWREAYVTDGRGMTTVDATIAPAQAYLGALGMPGMTAYIGLLEIGQIKAGETVFVSAAAGAVGAIACQIAKAKGCRVVGSAGSDEKVAWLLKEAGADAAFNYKTVENLRAELGKAAPNGVDVYFDNVGGDHLEAALDRMNNYGRLVICGMIAQYNATEATAAPRNLAMVIGKRLTLRGFIVSDHSAQQPQFFTEMGKWIAEGKITWQETIYQGIENAPKAFLGLFSGANTGKMLVKLD